MRQESFPGVRSGPHEFGPRLFSRERPRPEPRARHTLILTRVTTRTRSIERDLETNIGFETQDGIERPETK
jgi:hypothetical protein